MFSCNSVDLQIMFFLFIILGALLIVNMLIAMMGNTYLKVAETEKEWTRQVGYIVYPYKSHLSYPILFSPAKEEGMAIIERINIVCTGNLKLSG